jgi:hypothetical protein
MDKKRPSSKRYPPELKTRGIKMVQQLRREDPVTCSILRWELVPGEFVNTRISDLGCQWTSVASEVSRLAHRRTFELPRLKSDGPLQPSHSVQCRRLDSPGIASFGRPVYAYGCYATMVVPVTKGGISMTMDAR